MRLNWRKFLLALLSVMLGLGVVLSLAVDWACGCLFPYAAAMVFGQASSWPLYAANGVLLVSCAIGASILAKRGGRPPWVWVLASALFHVAAVCSLYALEPSEDATGLTEDLNNAPL